MSINIEDFYPYIRPDVPGVPEPVLKSILLLTLQAFCTQTQVWKETLAPVNAVADTSLYNFVLTFDSQVIGLIRATKDNFPVTIDNERNMDFSSAGWRDQTGAKATKIITAHKHGEYFIYPTPDSDTTDVFLFDVALKPNLTALTVGDILFEYVETIAAGTKARLMMMPKKDWSDINLAKVNMSIYNEGETDAKIYAFKGYSNEAVTMQARKVGS